MKKILQMNYIKRAFQFHSNISKIYYSEFKNPISGSNDNCRDCEFSKVGNCECECCWNCEHQFDEMNYFCQGCNKIQDPESCFFQNYFDLFDVPNKFSIDLEVLHDKYVELQQKLHPDKFVLKTETEQKFSNRLSAKLNDAYKTLLVNYKRANYMLEQNGQDINDVDLDGFFLMEIMEAMENVQNGSLTQEQLDDLEIDIRKKTQDEEYAFEQNFKEENYEECAQSSAKLNYYQRLLDLMKNNADI